MFIDVKRCEGNVKLLQITVKQGKLNVASYPHGRLGKVYWENGQALRRLKGGGPYGGLINIHPRLERDAVPGRARKGGPWDTDLLGS